jgi:PAS domain S-box-containing protein
MVRTYAATGNTKFESYFWDILDIRNGEKRRPLNYERVFWDFMTAETPQLPFLNGEKASLHSLMEDAGFTDAEFHLLALSHHNSDELVLLEEVAMHAMKGEFRDDDDGFSLKGAPDQEMALAILFGVEYHAAKTQIMDPINGFYAAIDKRTAASVHEATLHVLHCRKMLVVVFAFLLLAVVSLFWTSYLYQKLRTFQLNGAIDQLSQEVLDHQRAERELALSNMNFENEKERLSVTLLSIGDGVIATDVRGNVVLINRITEELTGWSQEEAAGRPLLEVFNIHNEKTGEICKNPVETVLSTGQSVELENHTALISRDGTHHLIEDSAAPIFSRRKKIVGAVVVYRDVTEKKRIGEELMKVKKLESVGVLAGGIAHDFNNVLSAILGNIDLARAHIDPSNEATPLLVEAKKACINAEGLTQQLLTFSRGGDPIRQVVSIIGVIRDSTSFVLHGSTVVCDFDIPDDLWQVDVDKGQMGQVIQNLIINARHAMPNGGVIKVSCQNRPDFREDASKRPAGDYISIKISDEGTGIPAELLEKVFDPYFTTKKDGSGLGLAICHSVIEKHDGSISVESEAGKGTTFTIYLPVTQCMPESEPLTGAPPP